MITPKINPCILFFGIFVVSFLHCIVFIGNEVSYVTKSNSAAIVLNCYNKKDVLHPIDWFYAVNATRHLIYYKILSKFAKEVLHKFTAVQPTTDLCFRFLLPLQLSPLSGLSGIFP